MTAYDDILVKQIRWAQANKIPLIGSKGARGRPGYTQTLDENLFEPLEPSSIESFTKGDGGEIQGTSESPAKMQALHSSSALGLNVFQYWQKIDKVSLIAAACGFDPSSCKEANKIAFEEKYSVGTAYGIPPNIDVVIHCADRARFRRLAIESKFSEAYATRRHSGLKNKYLVNLDIWRDIPQIHRLAETISPGDNIFSHLHPAQLIKHILGLKAAVGKDGFQLLYLWYEVPSAEGAIHRNEIELFKDVAKRDGIDFLSCSYQELISKLSQTYERDHPAYIHYISKRYL